MVAYTLNYEHGILRASGLDEKILLLILGSCTARNSLRTEEPQHSVNIN